MRSYPARHQTPPLSNLHPLGTLAAYRDWNIGVNPLQASVGVLMFTETMVRTKKSTPAVCWLNAVSKLHIRFKDLPEACDMGF